MAKKKSGKKDSSSDFDNNDMTRIEDLSSFFHKEDPEIEAFFKKANLPELPPEEIAEEIPEEIAETIPDEISFEAQENTSEEIQVENQEETPLEDFGKIEQDNFSQDNFSNEEFAFSSETEDTEESPLSGEFTNFDSTENFDFDSTLSTENEEQNEFQEGFQAELQAELQEGLQEDFQNDFQNEFQDEAPENLTPADENQRASQSQNISLNDLKNENIDYNQSTSFGHLPTSANPAFSLKIEGISPEYCDNIISILDDFQLLKNNSEKDYRLSLRNGSLLISQVNEFLVIHLATRLKRFGGAMLMGPSDLIFNSKIIKEKSPRGLHTKRIKEQSKKGSEILFKEKSLDNQEFFVHFQNTNMNFEIENHLGAVTTSIIIEEEDFNRIAHAQKMLNNKNIETSSEDQELYTRYADLLEHNKEKLVDILKTKAIIKNANSINNLQFQINTQSIKNKNMIIIQAHANADIIRIKPTPVHEEQNHE